MNRYQVSRYLGRRRKIHLSKYPQMACFAFDSISAQIMIDGQYESDILEFMDRAIFPRLKQRRLCLDVGANIGNHSLSFSRSFQRVQSFEPNDRVFQLLRFNSELVTNVTAFQVGASDQKQELPAYVWPSNFGGATVEVVQAEKTTKRGPHTMQQFKLDRLDDLISIEDQSHVDFIKIDVERHEFKALSGAINILKNARPLIAFEVLKTGIQDGHSNVVMLLKSFGYQHFYEISPSLGTGRVLSRLATKVLPDTLLTRFKSTSLQRVEVLENKNYPMMLASCEALSLS
jgi:FkbM family methyltransferase